MIAIQQLTSRKFRVLAPETPTAEVPKDLDPQSGSATEDGGFLSYQTARGEEAFIPMDARKLAFRKPGETCFVPSDELAPDGRRLWCLSRVEGRL